MVGIEREGEAAEVGDVLAHGEVAVDVHAGQRLEGVVLRAQLPGAVFERLGVVGGPPVAQVAVGVDLAALVVEAVGELVADHAADGAVVDGGVGVGIEDRRLQDRRRKHDVAQ